MAIGNYCRRDVVQVARDVTLREAARRMEAEGVGCLVVVEGTYPRGVVTDRDLALRVLREELDPDAVTVGEFAAPDPLVLHETTALRAAASVMRRRAVRRLPVVDDRERLVGILAADDLLPVLGRELAGLVAVIEAQSPRAAADVGALETAAPEVE